MAAAEFVGEVQSGTTLIHDAVAAEVAVAEATEMEGCGSTAAAFALYNKHETLFTS